MNTNKTIVFCGRCGVRCRSAKGNPKAKMLRFSKGKGLCVNCATHDWLRNTYPCNMLLAESGPKVLAYQHIRDQFAQIMRMGQADARPEEINWNLINENWDLPFPNKVKPSAANPCSQVELDEIKTGKRPGIGDQKTYKSGQKLMEFGGVIKSFEQLNEIEPGLGDQLKSTVESTLPNSKEKIMSKQNSMQKQVEKDEQMELMEVGPENKKEIVDAVKIYRGHLSDRLAAQKKELEWRDKVKMLVKKSELQPLKDGVIKCTYNNVTIKITPRDELITITEEKPKKAKKVKK